MGIKLRTLRSFWYDLLGVILKRQMINIQCPRSCMCIPYGFDTLTGTRYFVKSLTTFLSTTIPCQEFRFNFSYFIMVCITPFLEKKPSCLKSSTCTNDLCLKKFIDSLILSKLSGPEKNNENAREGYYSFISCSGSYPPPNILIHIIFLIIAPSLSTHILSM